MIGTPAASSDRASFSGGQLDRFDEVKARVDPEGILRSALADRLIYDGGTVG